MQWNHPVHHPQLFNTDYQIPRYPAYSNIRKVSNQGLVDGSFVRMYIETVKVIHPSFQRAIWNV